MGEPMAEESDAARADERFTNRVAITIAVLATFVALSAIKSGNLEQAMEQAQAERNNSWAWYQAVRVREDMATYELAHLQRLARGEAPAADAAPSAESARLAVEIEAQEGEVGRVRARKDEVEQRARTAEAEHARLSAFDDQHDLADALITVAMALLAVCVLAKARWLYWFALLPSLAGLGLGATAMLRVPIQAQILFAWLG